VHNGCGETRIPAKHSYKEEEDSKNRIFLRV
jgi:hypothetical protein